MRGAGLGVRAGLRVVGEVSCNEGVGGAWGEGRGYKWYAK